MFVEDLSVFFNVDSGFAVTASRTPVGGGVSPSAAVIFDKNGLDNAEFEVVTSEPSLIVPASVWPTLAEADLIAIGTANYKVRQTYPLDDGAISVAILKEV